MTQQLAQLKLSKAFIKLIRYLFTRELSSVQAIFGKRGTGKTDIALLITEILILQLKLFHHVATNIKIYDSPFPIEKISSLEDLKYWAKEKPGRKLYILDEIGRTINRRKPMSSLNVAMIGEFQILRKYKLSTIYITIDPRYVDNAILGSQILDGFFFRPFYKRADPRNKKIALYKDQLEFFNQKISNLPRTQIQFDTYDSALFTEYSKTRKPKFKSQDLDALWNWTHGASAEDMGVNRMYLSRIRKKFIKEQLEMMLERVT